MSREKVLELAAEAINGSRDVQYGAPEKNFGRIAALWETYTGVSFTHYDVAVMMMLVKVARIANDPNVKDNWVDIAGYAACGAEVAILDQSEWSE